MKIKLIAFTRNDETYISEGANEYIKRIKRYITLETILLKPVSSGTENNTREAEGEALLKEISSTDFVILLDAGGKQFTSTDFSKWLQTHLNSSRKTIVFALGGAYGFSEKIYERANFKLSLSSMTFPHQLCRLIFYEQLYRAFTIIKNEKYHH